MKDGRLMNTPFICMDQVTDMSKTKLQGKQYFSINANAYMMSKAFRIR